MNDAEVVTYATHAQGKFNELVHNEYGIPVKVLGWGDKWISYTESKAKGVYEYIKTLPKDKIIIYVDGFDTTINGTLEEVVKRFKTFNSEIVVSHDNPRYWGPYILNRTFGSCQQTTANAGLFMGYAGPLSKLLHQILITGQECDQRALNTVCSSSSNIAIDRDNLIFVNNDDQTDAIFIGFPGCTDCNTKDLYNRYKRDFMLYSRGLRYEIMTMLAISVGIFYYSKTLKYKHLPAVIIVILIIMFLISRLIPPSLVYRRSD